MDGIAGYRQLFPRSPTVSGPEHVRGADCVLRVLCVAGGPADLCRRTCKTGDFADSCRECLGRRRGPPVGREHDLVLRSARVGIARHEAFGSSRAGHRRRLSDAVVGQVQGELGPRFAGVGRRDCQRPTAIRRVGKADGGASRGRWTRHIGEGSDVGHVKNLAVPALRRRSLGGHLRQYNQKHGGEQSAKRQPHASSYNRDSLGLRPSRSL
jgi:hypothetical protein